MIQDFIGISQTSTGIRFKPTRYNEETKSLSVLI